jgi:hypothetical protein
MFYNSCLTTVHYEANLEEYKGLGHSAYRLISRRLTTKRFRLLYPPPEVRLRGVANLKLTNQMIISHRMSGS